MRGKFFAAATIALLSLANFATVAPAQADLGGAWPTNISLPNGFQPEGIAIDTWPTAYLGSLVDGSIYEVNLRTGRGQIVSTGPGTPSVGLKVDSRHRLFVAGGASGDARVVDARSGDVLASYKFTTGETFINDVVVTRDAAWFTDSVQQVLYKLPLGWRGDLPAANEFERLPLSGDVVFTDGFNANGIATTPDGRSLIIVQSNTGKLFQVDPSTGVGKTIDLGGESVTNGDGLLRDGRTLYVVQNQQGQVAKIELNWAGTKGKLVTRATDARFDVPTTVAAFGDRLYLPNARFNTDPTSTTPYNIIAIDAP